MLKQRCAAPHGGRPLQCARSISIMSTDARMKEQTFQPVDLSFLRGMRASMQHSVEDGWCRLEIDEQSKDDSFAVKSSGSDTFDNFYRYSLKKSHVACRLCLRREDPTGSIEQVMSLIWRTPITQITSWKLACARSFAEQRVMIQSQGRMWQFRSS